MIDFLSLASSVYTASNSNVEGVFGGLFIFGAFACCGLFNIAALGFWIWMLVDCCTKEFKNNDKIIWILVIVLTNWIGALIYLLVGRNTAIEPSDQNKPDDQQA